MRVRRTAWVAIVASLAGAGALAVPVAGSALPPASAIAAPAPLTTETLSNGVRLVVHERPGCGTFALQVTALGGGAEDPPALLGLSALLARMLLRGSEAVPANELARRVEATGSVLDARSGAAGVSLVASGPADGFAAVFDLVVEAALRPQLAAADLDKEVALARQSLAAARDNPSEALARTALPLIFGDHPLGRVVTDPAKYAEAVEIEAIRVARERRFVGQRLVVVVVGEVDAAAARARTIEAFGGLPPGEPAPPMLAPVGLQVERRGHARRRTSQPELFVALPTAGTTDADSAALDFLRHILGGFQERLSQQIRERRGWAYWLETWDVRQPGAGGLGFVTAVPRARLAATEALIRAEMARIAAEPPTAEEVERARRYLSTSRARAWQQSAERARVHTAALVEGRPARDYDEIAERYAAVTPEAIRDLAARIFGASKLAVVTLH